MFYVIPKWARPADDRTQEWGETVSGGDHEKRVSWNSRLPRFAKDDDDSDQYHDAAGKKGK